MGKGSAPKPPNTSQLIKQQGRENERVATANFERSLTNSQTPFGTLDWTKGPDGRWVATTKFTPEQQALLDSYTGYATNASDASSKWAEAAGNLNPSFNFTGPALGQYMLDQWKPQYDEEYERARNARTVELANKGIKEGSTAYINAMRDFDLNQGDVWERIQRDSRSSALEEALAQRNQIFKELESLRGGNVAPINSINPTQAPANYNQPVTDVAGITQQGYQNQLAAYEQDQAERNALMSGLFQIGGSILGGPIGGAIGKGASSAFFGK